MYGCLQRIVVAYDKVSGKDAKVQTISCVERTVLFRLEQKSRVNDQVMKRATGSGVRQQALLSIINDRNESLKQPAC